MKSFCLKLLKKKKKKSINLLSSFLSLLNIKEKNVSVDPDCVGPAHHENRVMASSYSFIFLTWQNFCPVFIHSLGSCTKPPTLLYDD